MATPTQGHGSTQASGKPAFPPFEKEHFASQLIWLAIAFVILYWLMSKIAVPRVAGILADRRARIEGDLAQAQKARDEAEAAGVAYEKSLAEARGRAQTIANETRDKFAAEAETARKSLEAQLNAKLADAEKSIAATKATAMTNVRGISVDTASAIVERLTGAAPAGPSVNDAVDRALKG